MNAKSVGRMHAHPKAHDKHFDPKDAPAYTLIEAARYIKSPVATLRSWVVGRPYRKAGGVARFEPLIQPP